MSNKRVVHRGNKYSPTTACGKKVTSKTQILIEGPLILSNDIDLSDDTSDPEVTCKLCIGEKSPLQHASYTRKRLLGDIAMATHCLRRIREVTGQKVDEVNLARLRESIDIWYEAKKVEYRK